MALSSLIELMQQRVEVLTKEIEDADDSIRKINIPEKRSDRQLPAKRARRDSDVTTPVEVEKPENRSVPLISSAIGVVRKSTEDDPRAVKNEMQRTERDQDKLNRMRKETLIKLGSDRDRDRNKRLFGALLAGTLQKFRSEQEHSKQLEDKRKEIDDKIQLRAELEIKELTVRRNSLVRERKAKHRTAKRLERKLRVATLFDGWCARQLAFAEFIPTHCADQPLLTSSNDRQVNAHRSSYGAAMTAGDQPVSNVYYRPRLLNDTTQALLDAHRHRIQDMIADRRRKLESDIENLLEQLDNSGQKSSDSTRLVSCIANPDAGNVQSRICDSESESSDFEGCPSDEELVEFGQSVNVRVVTPSGKRSRDGEH